MANKKDTRRKKQKNKKTPTRQQTIVKIATWNIRGPYQGKLIQLEQIELIELGQITEEVED